MNLLLNKNKIETTSKRIADKVLEEAFITPRKVNGEEILKLTSIPQINIFIVRLLFQKWKLETSKLESPFFDYSNLEVQKALKAFFNVLSHHISIDKYTLTSVLENAISDYIYLSLAPRDFFIQNYLRQPVIFLVDLKNELKYLKINKTLLENLVGDLEKNQGASISSEAAILVFESILLRSRDLLIKQEELISSFSSIIPLKVDELIDLEGNNMPVKEDVKDKKIEVVEGPKSKESEKENLDAVLKDDSKMVNEKFSRTQLTLNDSLGQPSVSLAEKFTKSKVDDIRNAIPLNKKFSFINELFNGLTSEYNLALSDIQESNNFDEAHNKLIENYGKKYNWNLENENVKELFSIIERRF